MWRDCIQPNVTADGTIARARDDGWHCMEYWRRKWQGKSEVVGQEALPHCYFEQHKRNIYYHGTDLQAHVLLCIHYEQRVYVYAFCSWRAQEECMRYNVSPGLPTSLSHFQTSERFERNLVFEFYAKLSLREICFYFDISNKTFDAHIAQI